MSKDVAVTIGHDVEGFLYNQTDGVVVSSIGKIGGSKHEPLAISGSKTGLRVQEDNVTIELNNTPVVVDANFQHNWDMLIGTAKQEAKAHVMSKLGKNHYIQWWPAAEFRPKDLEHPQAAEFGCDPDFLAHQYGIRRDPISAKQVLQEKGPVRFAGGHLHIGYNKAESFITPWALIQLIEAYVYYPCARWDNQSARRPYYGLAGLYREKEYGVEYRTPSNFWMTEDTDFPIRVGQFAKAVLSDEQLARDLYTSANMKMVADNINNPNFRYRDCVIARSLGAKCQEVINAFWHPQQDVVGQGGIDDEALLRDLQDDEEEEDNF